MTIVLSSCYPGRENWLKAACIISAETTGKRWAGFSLDVAHYQKGIC